MDLKKYNINCANEKTRPIYAKRYKDNGESYLKKIDEIDIEEDMKEKQLQINRIKEIFNQQEERLKEEELLNDLSNEDFLEKLKEIDNTNELDTYEFLNKTNELKEIYNQMPEKVRMEYKNIARFGKEYLPKLIQKSEKIIAEKQLKLEAQTNEQIIAQTNEEIEKQIETLKNQLKGDEKNV